MNSKQQTDILGKELKEMWERPGDTYTLAKETQAYNTERARRDYIKHRGFNTQTKP